MQPYADALLDQALHGLGRTRGRDVFVVNIGALDGSTFDGTAGYVCAYRWRGLFVEPIPELFGRLLDFYKGFDGMRFENAAIAAHDGEVTMLRVAPALVDSGVVHQAFLGMSSLQPARNGLASESDRPIVQQYGEEIRVPCLTVPSLLAKHEVESIDVIHVDVEGYDWMVLQQFDLWRWRPTVVRIEQSSLSSIERREARWYMRGAGLEVVDFYDELVGVRPGAVATP